MDISSAASFTSLICKAGAHTPPGLDERGSDSLPQNATNPAVGTTPTKKDPNAPIPTPLERMLLNAGPIRNDGSDKFFGMENV